MSNWRLELKFELDEQDLRYASFGEVTLLDMFKESYVKTSKLYEGIMN